MKSIWKPVAIVALCVATITGIGFGCRAYRTKAKLAETARLTRQRAEQGDAQAQLALGRMYYSGLGVPQNYVDAAKWYRKAAYQNYAKAQYGLGYLYSYGRGVPQDYAEALLWDRKAATQGLADAQSSLGSHYQSGYGVPMDYAEALRWYSEAAKQGNASAEDGLGTLYEQGLGVPTNPAAAARWYRKAADQGYAYAQDNLGKLYYYGTGVPQDRKEAYRWLSKAAAQGDDYASRALSKRLTPLGEFNLAAELLLGLWLSLSFVSFNYLVPHESLRNFQQKAISGTGVLWLIYGGMSWYGYTHHKIRSLWLYPNAFTLCRVALNTILTASLIYIIWKWMKRNNGSLANVNGFEAGAEE